MSSAVDGFNAGSLFFAVSPDAGTAECIYRSASVLKRARKFRGKLTAPERLHVTLFFLGAPYAHIIRRACESAKAVRMQPFEVSFDRTASFRGRSGNHPFVLLGDNGLRQLTPLRQMLGAAMVRNGLKTPTNKDFAPHVTLLYDVRNVEEQPIEPIFWIVREFVLIQSMNGHIHLARWPLRG